MLVTSTKKQLKRAYHVARRVAPPLHYVSIYCCSNCNEYNVLTIPCGVTVLDFASRIDCEYCKCKLTINIDDILGG